MKYLSKIGNLIFMLLILRNFYSVGSSNEALF